MSKNGSSECWEIPQSAKVLAELEDGIVIARVRVDVLKEQDYNARVMSNDVFSQLAKNIKKRGALEQLPYCAVTERGIEIISGHHRVRAARYAGLSEIDVLLDTNKMTRSAIAAKQLAHNAISGTDDPKVLKAIAMLVTDVDEMLETALPQEVFENMAESDAVPEARIKADDSIFGYDTAVLVFTEAQMEMLEKLCEEVPTADFVGIAQHQQYDEFVDAVAATRRYGDVINISAAVALMVETALKAFGQQEKPTSLVRLFGRGAVPEETAKKILGIMDTLKKQGIIEQPWEIFDVMASVIEDGNDG